jgi:hypothetical protein
VEGVREGSRGESDQALAEGMNEAKRLRAVLEELRRVVIQRALVSWDRSTEMFGEEIVAFNDVEEALRNLG